MDKETTTENVAAEMNAVIAAEGITGITFTVDRGKPTTAEKREIQQARQLWRLCCAAESVLAGVGASTKVEDVLKFAVMSRRTYYECFGSLVQQVIAMNWAAFDGLDEGEMSGDFPSVPWMAYVYSPGTVHGNVDPGSAFIMARIVLDRDKAGLSRPRVSDAALLRWAQRIRAARIACNMNHVGVKPRKKSMPRV